ncbi:MAG: DUF368 domain-containing protein [Gammaproteobacteria bacterium]|nr:DUF368 domain-containing protein [Gammaproteobacteria bacterium]
MKQYLVLYLKGLAMGIADLVPGVSGGTVALISGIYYQLVKLLAQINLAFFGKLLTLKFAALQKEYEIVFFIVLGAGILSGIAGGAGLVHYALENYSPVVYALFGGLIIVAATNLITTNLITKSSINNINVCGRFGTSFGGGILFALVLIFWLNINLPWTPLAIFAAGGLAICAMLLPGISGSLILLLLGLYEPILNALVNLDFYHLSFFIAGALTTLFGFSKLIMFSLKKYNKQTMGFMSGLMLGVLPKLWPWQDGETSLVLMSPAAYSSHGNSAYLVACLVALAVGLAIIPLVKYKR